MACKVKDSYVLLGRIFDFAVPPVFLCLFYLVVFRWSKAIRKIGEENALAIFSYESMIVILVLRMELMMLLRN